MTDKHEASGVERCPECRCTSYARVQQQDATGKFVDGPDVRCVHCKIVRRLLATPPASAEQANGDKVPAASRAGESEVVPMLLFCPECGLQHIDEPDERTPEWQNPPHRSHLCHGCGCIWRPADFATEGVLNIATVGKADTWMPTKNVSPAAATVANGDKALMREGAVGALKQIASGLSAYPQTEPVSRAIAVAALSELGIEP